MECFLEGFLEGALVSILAKPKVPRRVLRRGEGVVIEGT